MNGMKIIKKSGEIVAFNPSKIITSIENAADDIGVHITASEIDIFLEDIEEILKKLSRLENNTSTYEIRSLVTDILLRYGYKNVAKAYILNMF